MLKLSSNVIWKCLGYVQEETITRHNNELGTGGVKLASHLLDTVVSLKQTTSQRQQY